MDRAHCCHQSQRSVRGHTHPSPPLSLKRRKSSMTLHIFIFNSFAAHFFFSHFFLLFPRFYLLLLLILLLILRRRPNEIAPEIFIYLSYQLYDVNDDNGCRCCLSSSCELCEPSEPHIQITYKHSFKSQQDLRAFEQCRERGRGRNILIETQFKYITLSARKC